MIDRKWFSLLVLSLVLLAAPAFAQDAPGLGGFNLEALLAYATAGAAALCGLYFVGAKLVDRMAARPQLDRWDEVKAKLDEFTPYVEKVKRWADPENPEIPPSPNNPAGLD